MSIFDDLFSKPDAAPRMGTVDVAKELGVGAQFNIDQLEKFKEYAPDFSTFMKGQFESLQDPRAAAAEQTQFDVGGQLANRGQTDLMGDFFDYSRRQGLETAAATGAPISGSFTQSLGSNLGAQQLLQNQLKGLGILGNQTGIQNQRTMSFMQPAFNILGANMVNPATTLQAGFQNNEIMNQNRMIDFANSQRQSWFDTLLSDTAKSVVGSPFKFVGNSFDLAANSPQIVGGMAMNMCGGGGGGMPASGAPSQGFTATSFSNPGMSGSFGMGPSQNVTMGW